MKKTFLFFLAFILLRSGLLHGSESEDFFFDDLEKKIGTVNEFPIESLQDTLHHAVVSGDSVKVAKSCYLFGKYYLVRTFNYPLAYNYFFRALNIFKNSKDLNREGRTEMQIGLIYYLQKNYNEAIPYFESGYEKSLQVNDSIRAGRLAYLLGLAYSDNKDSKKALHYLNVSKAFAGMSKSDQSLREYSYGMGKYYLNISNSDSALYYFMPLYNSSIELNDTPNVQRYGAELAMTWNLRGNSAQTEYYAKNVISHGRNINTGQAFMNCYHLLYRISYEKGNYKEAVEYLNKYVLLKDSIINEKNLFDLASLNIKLTLENEKKENELREAKQREMIVEEQKRTRLYQVITLSFFVIVIITFVALADSRRKKKKIESVQQQLINQEKLASMGKLSAGIAHEMLNPLNFIAGFSKGTYEILDEISNAQSEKERTISINETKKIVQKISDHADRMEESVQKILNHVRISPGKAEITNINDLCNTYLNISINSLSLQDENFNPEIIRDYSTGIPSLTVNTQEVGRVLVNIFSNAFLAIQEKLKTEQFSPRIKIATAMENKMVTISISDNGIGIRKEIREKIFDHFFTTRLPGKGVGLGLSVAKDIISSYGGKITVDSTPLVSTTFKIEIPFA